MVLKSKKTLSTLLILITLCSCTKEISVDVAHEPQTVIFGELNNLNQQVSINIQQTLPLNASGSFQAINNAMVSLYEKTSNGTTNLVTDDFSVNQGVYISNQAISTVVGNKYWIEIVLTNGARFKSEEETMLPVVPISEIEIDSEFDDIINVSFNDPEGAINFYKASVSLYNQGTLVSTNFIESNDVVFDGNSEASLGIDLFQFQEEDDETPLPDYDAIEVLLGNINFSSYQFLLNQRSQIEANEDAGDSSGGDPSQLFSTPPVSLLGNITNTTTNKTALGNFTVISLSIVNQ
ncbi:DUF4249 family protein [uncultured Lacinutrix sp.]|uniref:DUF4249 family protein n=1 Tax=uncultured Lacinutrix sp. TaxID=574032 RepID=UPI002615BD61|nr:DUF4249 family protein [uncultured Lacinutrix sp.]